MIFGGGQTLAARTVAPLALLLACAGLEPHRSESTDPEHRRRTVVIVPGVTGVELADADTGKLAWGRGLNLLGPIDGGYRLAVPIGSPGAERLVPGRAIDRIRLGPISKPIYAPVERRFEREGWRRGDLRRPEAPGGLFFFAYDWRRDNIEAAALLAERLENLARHRAGRLEVSLVCQSNGAHVCRYLVKHGGTTLEAAEAARPRPLRAVSIEQVVLVGTANGGSLRILRQLNSKRRYLPVIGRTFRPEIFFTYESLYQDLPSYRDDLFVDEEGAALEVDIWDVASWERYGWSVFDPGIRRRLSRHTDLFGDAERRRDFLERALDRGRRLQELLRRDDAIGETHYFMIQNRSLPTPDRAVLRPVATGSASGGAWETLITGDPALRRHPVAAAVTADGDGHAPTASQQWLTPSEMAALEGPPLLVEGRHFEMILDPEALERLVEICSE